VELKIDSPYTRKVKYAQNLLLTLNASCVWLEMNTIHALRRTSLPQRERYRIKWSVNCLIESMKACCRLIIFIHNGHRMLLAPSSDELVIQAIKKQRSKLLTCKSSELALQSKAPSMQCIPSHSKEEAFENSVQMYISHGRRNSKSPHSGTYSILNDTQIDVRETSLFKPSIREIISEIVFICRPLIYVYARLMCKERSWKPFFLSLCADFLWRVVLPPLSKLSPNQRTEVIKRMFYWMVYLLRTPFFELYSKKPLLNVTNKMSRIPIIGIFFHNLADLIVALQSHYFYTCAN